MLRALGSVFAKFAKKYLPDALIFAMILTIITLILGMVVQKESFVNMVKYMGDGFWNLLSFAMQMTLIVVTGYILATTKPIKAFLSWIARFGNSPFKAVALVTFVMAIFSWFQWGLGLIVGALLAVEIARNFGMSDEDIKKAVAELQPVEHRLQMIKAGGKIILDDGYNGNIDGMLEAIRLCSLHDGRKVIVTPGLVESSDELNLQLIDAINRVFDIVIVTGALNAELFNKNLRVKNKIMLADKSTLTDVLGSQTKAGDIILFVNDAPNFI